jgi:pyrophosphatase PpaX
MLTPDAPFTALLFDLDGTLIDSIRLILDSFHHTLRAHGIPPQSDAELLVHVGRPLAVHLAHYTRGPGSVSDDGAPVCDVEALVATYRAWNLAQHDQLVRAFDGAVEAVDAIAALGLPLGVVTSKQRAAALRGLEVAGFCRQAGALAPFEVLVGADDVTRHKPDPLPLLVALERLGVPPARAAYVGDSPHDLAAARAAGMTAVAVGWGPFERSALAAVGYDHWLEHPADLVRLAQGAR